jgi:NitT/TauT family transport system ATP-binding protein
MSLTIKKLNKSFGSIHLFKDFNLELKEHTITCILGPSGCGKTTLLNIISNSVQPDSGNFFGFNEKTLSYIFQEPRLLPWKTVRENIAFVTKNKSLNTEQDKLIDKYLQLVNLEDFADYFPNKLSGGMKQRVAIARAFSYPSDLILMDEPLKALDLKLKLNLISAFRKIWQNDRRTVIFVTHDIDEALLLGNEIYVFSKPPIFIKEKFTIDSTDRSLQNPEIINLKNKIWEVMD